MKKSVIRLPLEGAQNIRDLGGYVSNDKRVGNFGVYIRGNSLLELTDEDNEYLKEYGITDVIDLRSKEVSSLEPDKINNNYFKYHNVSLLNDKFNENLVLEGKNFKMGNGYLYILENKEAIKNIFEILSESIGGTLFHCTAGKDRTGIISMLILGVSGIAKKDIVANYEVTYTYVPILLNEKIENIELAYSTPEYILTAINFIEEEYGSYENFLKNCGISSEVIKKVINKYLD